MNYQEGVEYIRNLATESGSFSPYEGIIINYPGRKGKKDYRLELKNGIPPKHSFISKKLYNLIIEDRYNFEILQDFLSDIYENGTNTPYADSFLENLKHLIYWITLQEEINYPRKRNCAGINLVFCRFFEAIYCSQNEEICLEDVINRCNNHGDRRPDLYEIENAPEFYRY